MMRGLEFGYFVRGTRYLGKGRTEVKPDRI